MKKSSKRASLKLSSQERASLKTSSNGNIIMDASKYELSEQELIVLSGLVSNKAEWDLLKKLFRYEIDSFWHALHTTDPADSIRILANHKLAAGVEASLGDLVIKLETLYEQRTKPRPEYYPDTTTAILEN